MLKLFFKWTGMFTDVLFTIVKVKTIHMAVIK